MIDKINLRIIMLDATKYDLFKGFKFEKGTAGMMQMGMIFVNIIFFGAITFFAFKTLQGLYQYFQNHENPQLKAQYRSDAFEPFKGLIMMMFATTIMNIFVFLIWGNTLGITFE